MLKSLALASVFMFSGFFAPSVSLAQSNHEYAPLQEKTVNYKNWTLKDIKTKTPTDLRSLIEGKKLVLVVYFAPWCPNWIYEAPVVARLLEKYKSRGFDIVAISEYASTNETRRFFGEAGAPYIVVAESERRGEREKTPHHTYRRATGDTRNWGSPYNVFIEPAKATKEGDVLVETAWIANGELIESQAEQFIRARLGLESKIEPQTMTTKKAEDSKNCALEIGPAAKKN